uniref:Translocation protein SEC62 n=1 Tax=Megaselia scalaris TaxID=36166 RepID=T1GP09_MEGSC
MTPLEPETIENIKEHDDSMILRKREQTNKKSSESSHSESESEASRSSTGKDFEIEYAGPGEQPEVEKPSKDEYKVAKWMKKNIKTKKTKFLSHNVEYFSAGKTLDALMNSKKVQVHPDSKQKNVEKDLPKEDKSEKTKSDSENVNVQSNEEPSKTKEKRKRKIRLDMHSEQVFVDGSEAYVWIYDPIPIHYWIFGLILLLGAILICLFPLWPPLLRKGVYYLSVAAAGFLVFILALVVIRFIVFITIYLGSLTKLHFWILPNLTEDVGFLASFWPLYE